MSFGIALPVFFALLGVVVRARFDSVTAGRAVWAVGATIVLLYACVARVRKPILVGWTYLVYPIAWLVTHALLSVVFIVAVTPIAILMRLRGHDPLGRRFDPSASSYWVERKTKPSPDRYLKQF